MQPTVAAAHLLEHEVYAERAMTEFRESGRSARFRVLQDIALAHLGRARRARNGRAA
jgi:hypothetical protein